MKKQDTKCKCRRWEIDEALEKVKKLSQQVEYLTKVCTRTNITLYSADSDICIGMYDSKWHRIVCKYNGDICLGPPRTHWQSEWSFKEDGLTLESFVKHNDDNTTIGWRGQYKGEMKFHQLPREVLDLHHNKIVEFIKQLSIWYPAGIYNDFTDEHYYP